MLARKLLGWNPTASLQYGLEKTLPWFTKHPELLTISAISRLASAKHLTIQGIGRQATNRGQAARIAIASDY
jgi:hypothetical protein